MDGYNVCKNATLWSLLLCFWVNSQFYISLLNQGHIFTQIYKDYVLLGGLCLLVFNEIFMYLLFFVQRVDGGINLLFSKTTIQWISLDKINYTIPALGSRGWYGWRVWPRQTSNLGPFASIYHTLPMSSGALKTDTRNRVLGSYLYQPLPHHGPWIVIWSLNNWGELKIMCILFN